jgi:hypothetical protein
MQQVWQNDTHQDWQQQSMPKGFHFFFVPLKKGLSKCQEMLLLSEKKPF